MKRRKTQTEKFSGRFGSALALAALLLAVCAGQAQEVYHPITDGCSWSVSNEKYMTAGDTVLDGKTYLKIYRQMDYCPFEFDMSNAEYFAAIRNDTTEKKVYAYLPAGTLIRDLLTFSTVKIDTDMEVLVYDFSLKIGDTITFYSIGDYVVKSVAVCAETAYILVGESGFSAVGHQYSEADTLVILSDNSSRSQVFLQGLYFANHDYVWIEGIGSVRGFNEGTQISMSDYGYRILLCFTDSSGVTFQSDFDLDNESNDCFTGGFGGDLPEKKKLNVRIYPNPVTEQLYISAEESDDNDLSISIFNMMGKCIHSEKILGTELGKINLKYLPSGIYLVQIELQKKHFAQKIIKL